MTVKDDISAFFNALQSCWDAAERGEHDGKNPAGPPPREVAWEGATLCSKPIAALLDCRKIGVLPDVDMGRRRSPSSNPPKSSATPGEPPMGDSSIHPPRLFNAELREIALAEPAARRRKHKGGS